MSKKRLLYLTLIIATLTIGVVIGTIVSGGVKAGEQKAQALVIPDPVSLSNAFSEIAVRLDPAVVNISTEATPEAPVRGRNRGDFSGSGRTDIALVGGQGWTTVPVAFANGGGTWTITNLI